MRQLADLVGISNPYLSQIEHGLREPSEKVLDAIAENLQLSAEALYEHGARRQDEDIEESAGRSGDPGGPASHGATAPGAARGLPRVRRRAAPLTVAAQERRDRRIGGGAQETSSRAALVYAFATSRVKSAWAAAVLTIQSTLVVPAAFS